MLKNTASQKVIVFAFDSTTNLPKSGDAANITAYISKDFGAVTALTDTSATEMDATNAKGYYLFDITQTETNADVIGVTAKSSTANIVVVGAPATIFTFPTGGIASPTNITAATGVVLSGVTHTGAVIPTVTAVTGLTAANLDVAVSTRLATAGYTAPLDAAGTRTAIGLASANLDTQLTAIDDFLDTEVAAIKAKTDLIPAAPASTTNITSASGISLATGGVGTGDIDATALNEIADAILDRILSAGTDSGLNTTAARTVRQALRALRNRVAISAGTMTVYKEDDSTLSWNSTMTRTAGDPISESNPA